MRVLCSLVNAARGMTSHPVVCGQVHRHCSSTTLLQGIEDRFKGVSVNIGDAEGRMDREEFDRLLSDSVKSWRSTGRTGVWLHVPIEHSHLIPTAAERGFSFHHAEGTTATLCQWLVPNITNKMPQFATHQVGVAGCVIRPEEKEILIIQERSRRGMPLWKFPGGLSELGEDIGQTAVREVFEETGITTEFRGILALRQQHNLPGAFGRSDLYILCHLVPLTFDLHPDTYEISKCTWMNVDELLEHEDTTPITQQTLKVISKGMRHGFKHVQLSPVVFKTDHRGLVYKMYHRDIFEEEEESSLAMQKN